ncbi:MAG: hypothetical protein R3C28_17675 [Pirellulaceae bacterium]
MPRTTGRIQSDRFLYQQPNGTRWDENDMQLAFQTMLTLQGWVPGSVNAFRANLVTPEDTLDVQLTQPVAQVAADTRWPLRVRLCEVYESAYPAILFAVADGRPMDCRPGRCDGGYGRVATSD